VRELVWMADGRGRGNWAIASSIMAAIANVFRDPKKRPARPSDFDPYARQNAAADAIRLDSMAPLRARFESMKGS